METWTSLLTAQPVNKEPQGSRSTHLVKDGPGDVPAAQGVIAQGQQVCGVPGGEVHAAHHGAVRDEHAHARGLTVLKNKSQCTPALTTAVISINYCSFQSLVSEEHYRFTLCFRILFPN